MQSNGVIWMNEKKGFRKQPRPFVDWALLGAKRHSKR